MKLLRKLYHYLTGGHHWHCGHDGRCCQCGMQLSGGRARGAAVCVPNGLSAKENVGR